MIYGLSVSSSLILTRLLSS